MEKTGQKLFCQAEQFYIWYMSRIHTSGNKKELFQTLAELMKMAEHSYQGGLYLSPDEEETAVTALTDLRTDLSDGILKPDKILEKLQSITERLTHDNIKARLVSRVTKVEYKFCIRSRQDDDTEEFHRYVQELFNTVNPNLLEIHAFAIDQIVAEVLEHSSSPAEAKKNLEAQVRSWIG